MYVTYFEYSHALLSLPNFFQTPHVYFYNTLCSIALLFRSMGKGPSPKTWALYQWPHPKKLFLSFSVALLKMEWKRRNWVDNFKEVDRQDDRHR